MRFFFLYFIYGIFALTLQSTWLYSFSQNYLYFDFMFMAIATLAFTTNGRKAFPVVVLLGALSDVSSVAPFGMSILAYAIVYGFMRAVVAKVSFHVGLGRFFWVGLLSLVDKFSCGFLLFLWTGNDSFLNTWLSGSLSQALCDAIFAFMMIPFLTWYQNLTWHTIYRPKGLVMK